ncbi:hypothetical protein F5972_21540 [Microbispora cellulosiformans]|uniref:SGNH hydrolase-type esterase domain-containing protein n=1 Tax=Microbispora cellulosiformans TaxID=2614688 RepID=A0A5J5JYW9_9ACTN|nr:SGNH/GDSL hydrolase family protein [Microbispora cellulosiformans]KAA9377028.1 hypothetical protein F5972_21540 [Microbispora cellulosiformans]
MSNNWTAVFQKIGNGFGAIADKVSGWWGGSVNFFRTLRGALAARGPEVQNNLMNRAIELGWAPRTTALRVLPLGDSITHGVGGSPGGVGYRGRLWSELQDDTSTLDFVGSVDSGQGNIPDTDHEGHPRWQINQIDNLVTCTIRRFRPNVVVLHIGTNDLNNDVDVATAPARLSKLIGDIVTADPLTTVVVSSLVPSTNGTTNARIASYNSRIPAIVSDFRNEGKRVRLVGNGDLGLTAADMNDSLHPNNNGYRKMADAYHRVIKTAMADGTITPPLPGDSGECVPAPAEPAPPPTDPPPGTPTPDGWNWAGEIATGAAPREQVRFADLNGDGRDDYLVVDDQGGVRAWFNNGAGGPTVNPPMPADPDQGDGGMGTPPGGLPLCVANRCP